MPQPLTVPDWKARYLFGIPDTDPATGASFAATSYQYHLDLAYATLSDLLDLPILPEEIVDERHDYYAEDYQNWAWLHLKRYPLVQVTSVKGRFPQNQVAVDFPSEWIVVDRMAGHLQMIPTGGTISQFMIGSSSLFLPLIQRGSYIPQFWSVDYLAGFPEGQIPMDINDAAAKIACMSVCSILGDLLGGVGVLGGSIGLDGLSQFISMTKTATTSGFYSRILQYRTELFGASGTGGPGSQIHRIKRKYKGIKLLNL
jgi:hypothetical protein